MLSYVFSLRLAIIILLIAKAEISVDSSYLQYFPLLGQNLMLVNPLDDYLII